MGDLPRKIGAYRILAQLGEGGMGAVYEAVHDAIERRVAIKVLRPELAQNAAVVTRFFNEARAVNRIGHPGLVQISDLGKLPDGRAYLVMELLPGITLRERLRRNNGPLDPREAFLLGSQLADALAAAHAKEIVHRDLKPENIMLIPDSVSPSGERSKVLDFGIAKLAAGDASASSTRSDVIMGTPRYMSPEQCRSAGRVDSKSDVYSFGVILYQMLAGRPPFVSDAPGELLVMHLRETPPPLLELVPTVPPEAAALCARLLAKEPAERPSMAELAEQLAELSAKYGTVRRSSMSLSPLPPVSADAAAAPAPTGTGESSTPLATPVPGGGAASATNNSSLLQLSAGQLRERLRRLRRPWLVPVTLFAGVLALVVVFSRPRRPAPAPPPPVQAAASKPPVPPRRTCALSSEPAGATVVRSSDGQRLGITPLDIELGEQHEPLSLLLRRDGFAEEALSLEREADVARHVVLRPLRSKTEPAARSKLKKPKRGKSIFDQIN